MEIKDSRIITELKVVRSTLKDIDCEKINFDEHVKIIKAETSLDVLINIMEGA